MDQVLAKIRTQGGFPAWLFIVFVVVAFVVWMIYITTWSREYHTPDNVQNRLAKEMGSMVSLESSWANRKPMVDFLKANNAATTTNALLLSNLYIYTANAAGLFFPSRDGIVSPEAVRLAARAGARAFVFDIWPCLSPHGGFKPLVQQVESGSKWRRETMNAVSFESALEPVLTEIYGAGLGGQRFQDDMTILYLRFHGGPRLQTYSGVAAALQRFVEPYRLDISYNAGRGRQRLMRSPVGDLKGRVIVVSNQRAADTPLEEYINIWPEDGIAVEYSPEELQTAVADASLKAKIKDAIVFAIPAQAHGSDAANNSWQWGEAHKMGVHCAAINVLAATSADASDAEGEMFGTYSYVMKPATLRLAVANIPSATPMKDTGMGDGTITSPKF